MISDIVRHLMNVDCLELRTYCAAAVFNCAEDPKTRDLVRQAGGLDPLVNMAKDSELRKDKDLLAAVTGAIWKCAASKENVVRLMQVIIFIHSHSRYEIFTKH